MRRIFVLCLLALSACHGQARFTPTQATPSTPPPPAVVALPAGGSDVLGSDTFKAFGRTSSEATLVETFAPQGQPFSQAWRFTNRKALEQPYFDQLGARNTAPIGKGDALVVEFWARSVGDGPARTEFVLEWNGEPYDKSVAVGVALTPTWTLFRVPFAAHRAFAPGQANALFRLGYTGQSFELGGVALRNYGQNFDLSSVGLLGFDYAGREPNAAWRAQADARIERLRKAELRVQVRDASGKAVPGAQVRLEMRRHAFPFGSAVDAERLLGDSADSRKYRETVLELFNRVVLENDLKWPVWECCQQRGALRALEFFRANAIPVRGHNLLWPCDDRYCLPGDVVASLADPAKLRARIDAHFVDILGATKGKIVEWDVINEPSANKRLSKVLGEDEMARQLERAKQLAPEARMVINDYGNLGEGDLDTEFKRILRRMLALGAPLEGIGVQAHFGYKLTPPSELYTRLEDFGKLGLPLSITEFDVNLRDERLQADYLRDFLTVAFSSEHVSSFLMWGFWAGQHWLPDAALYRKDWSLKPNGQAFKDLVFGKWWTRVSGPSDAQGVYSTRGFLGDYTLTVSAGGRTVTRDFKLEKSGGEVEVVL